MDNGPSIDHGPVTNAASRLYALDLLRFVAAALVLSYHLIRLDLWHAVGAGAGRPVLYALGKIPDYGWMGVELFFMISGFVICMSSWGRSLSEFFVSRTVRLLPAYLFAVALTTVLLFTFSTRDNVPAVTQVLGNLTMLQEVLGIQPLDFSYWTLLVELKFYLLFAAIVAIGLTYRRVVVFCVIYTTISLFAQFANDGFLIAFTRPDYTSYFVVGITLYLIHRYGPNLLLWGILATSAVLCAIALSHHVDGHIGVGERVNFGVALPILLAFFVAMLAATLGWLDRLRWRGLAVVGALTYPMYLLHQTDGHIAIRLFKDQLPPWLLLTAIVAVLLLVSYGVHVWIEKPVGRAMRRGLRASFTQVRADAPRPAGRPGPAHRPSLPRPVFRRPGTVPPVPPVPADPADPVSPAAASAAVSAATDDRGRLPTR